MSAFASVFDSGDYLSLLHLGAYDAGVVERIGLIARECEDLPGEMRELLSAGWRPALVGCLALFGRCSEELLDLLWEAMDQGSWVAPQMAVTLWMLDPRFGELARRRLLEGCPPQREQRPITAEVHVIEGPAGVRSLSAKTRVSLMTVIAHEQAGREWLLANVKRADALQDILVEDAWDGSARLVSRWGHALAACLERPGLEVHEDVLLKLWPSEGPAWLMAGEVSAEFLEPLLRAGVTELEWRPDERGTVVVAEPVGKVRFNRPYDSLLLQHLERHSLEGCYRTPLGNLRLHPGPPIRLKLESERGDRILLSRCRLEEAEAEWLIHGAAQDGRLKSGPGAALLGLAGPELEYELMARLSQGSRELGQVIQTEAYQLGARGVTGVLHVVALDKPRGCSRPEALGEGLLAALRRCSGKVAIASMGSGGGGLDPARVAPILVGAAREALVFFRGTITFCLPNDRDYQAFSRALQATR